MSEELKIGVGERREREGEEEPTGMYGKHEKHLQMQHKSVTPHVSIHVRGKVVTALREGVLQMVPFSSPS